MSAAGEQCLLASILEARQIPQQPLVVLRETAFVSGLPLVRDAILRSINSTVKTILITFVRPPSTFLPHAILQHPLLKLHDLSSRVPGFSTPAEDTPLGPLEQLRQRLNHSSEASSIVIEGLETFAQDWDDDKSGSGTKAASQLLRELLALLRKLGCPSRLTLLLSGSDQSTLVNAFISPELTPTLTLLHLHPKNLLLTHFPAQYLLPPTSSPGTDLTISTLLRSARERDLGESLALQGADGVDALGDWGDSGGDGVAVEIFVRKAQGGASKGISRSIELLEPVLSDDYTTTSLLSVKPLPSLHHQDAKPVQARSQIEKTLHLDLPFNLTLTESQRQARADVPVPYAHEGDETGEDKVAGAGIWWEADEDDGLDDEDEEI